MAGLLHVLLHRACLAVILPGPASALPNPHIVQARSRAAQSAELPGIGLMQLESRVHPPATPVLNAARIRALFEPEGECATMLEEHRKGLRERGFDVPLNGFHTDLNGKGRLFGMKLFEGSISDDEFNYLTTISTELGGEEAMLCQTGFNYGVSTVAFLCATPPGFKVRSWDIGTHEYVQPASELIEARFPGRHELTIGDSTGTLKAAAANSTSAKCDLAFVDGGHSTDVCLADIVNFQKLVRPGTKVFVDDCAVQAGNSLLGRLFPRSLPLVLPGIGMSLVNQCVRAAARQRVIGVVEGNVSFKGILHHVCVGEYPRELA